MVDIHSHLLFGVDDGAQTIEESMELIKQSMDLGYTDIVLTSHYGKRETHNQRRYDEHFKILGEKLKKEGWGIQIHRGNELYLDEKILDRKSIEHCNCLGEGRYMLVEFHPMIIPMGALKKIEELKKWGITPVIAHVERYVNFRLGEYRKLKERGALLQVNIRSVKTEKRVLGELIKNRLIDVMGTDSHGLDRRDYKLEEHIEELKKLMGEDEFKRVTRTNPRKILKGQRLREEVRDVKKKMDRSTFFADIVNYLLSGLGFNRDIEESRGSQSRGKDQRV